MLFVEMEKVTFGRKTIVGIVLILPQDTMNILRAIKITSG
jgi:hypothetical protein